MEATISSPSMQIGEKLEESYKIARDTTILVGLYTWAHLEVRDEFIAIGVSINMCRDP